MDLRIEGFGKLADYLEVAPGDVFAMRVEGAEILFLRAKGQTGPFDVILAIRGEIADRPQYLPFASGLEVFGDGDVSILDGPYIARPVTPDAGSFKAFSPSRSVGSLAIAPEGDLLVVVDTSSKADGSVKKLVNLFTGDLDAPTGCRYYDGWEIGTQDEHGAFSRLAAFG